MLGVSTTAWAQGSQTGSLTGTVTDQDGLAMPGVTVTATSPASQGARSTVTDGNGVYTLPGLPAGDYVVRFELSGFRTAEAKQTVSLGQPARVDSRLQLASLTETVQVTAETPTILSTVQGGANYRAEEIDRSSRLASNDSRHCGIGSGPDRQHAKCGTRTRFRSGVPCGRG